MDLCSAIDKWVERGCDVNEINPMFVKNIDHWTGQKIGGALFNQKFQTGEPEKLLKEVRKRTEFLTVRNVVKVSGTESNSPTTQDDNISDNTSVGHASISDSLVDSDAFSKGCVDEKVDEMEDAAAETSIRENAQCKILVSTMDNDRTDGCVNCEEFSSEIQNLKTTLLAVLSDLQNTAKI